MIYSLMTDFTFVTGRQEKVKWFEKIIGRPVRHHKMELDEIQSLDLKEVVEKKLRSAYEALRAPVVIEDCAAEFVAFKRLPGTFIKFFLDELGLEGVCRMVDGRDRTATARCIIGFTDGRVTKLFEGRLDGEISMHPQGNGGFGFDKILAPSGYGGKTRAELSEHDDIETYRQLKPFDKLVEWLEGYEGI